MKRWIASVTIVLSVAAAGSASAQEGQTGSGKVEVTVIPGGWTHFSKNTKTSEPSFGSYNLGGAVSYNFNRLIGVEGEAGGSIGLRQHLGSFAAPAVKERNPNMFAYSVNVVVNATSRKVVPYATAGVGGLVEYRREVLGVMDRHSFLTGNVGGGLKWFAPNGRWGVRGDYRLEIVGGRDDSSSFFGEKTRYGQRVYGGVIINAVR